MVSFFYLYPRQILFGLTIISPMNDISLSLLTDLYRILSPKLNKKRVQKNSYKSLFGKLVLAAYAVSYFKNI